MHVEALHVVSSVENVSYLTASVNLMLRSLTAVSTIVEVIVAFMSVWSVIGLAGFHSYLVCCNITTNEDVSLLLT